MAVEEGTFGYMNKSMLDYLKSNRFVLIGAALCVVLRRVAFPVFCAFAFGICVFSVVCFYFVRSCSVQKEASLFDSHFVVACISGVP